MPDAETKSVLIVEDEILVAMDMEAVALDLGLECVGIAADTPSALDLAAKGADIALVDINLRDGETGIEIGQRLVREHGVTVVFMTANPSLLGDGVAGAIGVLPKPCSIRDSASVLRYAVQRREGRAPPLPAPQALRLFG